MNAYSVSPEILSNRSQESEMMSCKLKCLHFTKDEVVRFFTIEYIRLQVPREQQVVDKGTQRILNSDLWF